MIWNARHQNNFREKTIVLKRTMGYKHTLREPQVTPAAFIILKDVVLL
jgi:hypothetical protein